MYDRQRDGEERNGDTVGHATSSGESFAGIQGQKEGQ